MNINLLFKYEDVYKRISVALLKQNFISNWSRVSICRSLFARKEIYVCLPRLNIITLPSSIKLIEGFLLSRYKSKNFLVRIIQIIYIKLASNFSIFSILLSHERFEITWNQKGVYTILGGSSYARIISHLDSRLVSVLKGDRHVFDRELDFRLEASGTVGQLPLLEVDRNGSYVEPFYIHSTGINGDNYIQDHEFVFNAVTRLMKRLHSETLTKITCNTYKCSYFKKLDLCSIEIDSVILKAVDLLFEKIVDIESLDYSVTHGDLQLCNIIINDKDVYIIDWETLDSRATVYDEMILYSSSRKNLGQIDDYIGMQTHRGSIFVSYLFSKFGNRALENIVIYYLEEILFRLNHSKDGVEDVERWVNSILPKLRFK